jgi:C_GCAxxG_C_C family probable redox protein
MGLTCGAVTGAFMVIGLAYGRTEASDKKSQAKTARAIKEFVRQFEAKHRFIVCNDLLQVEGGGIMNRILSGKSRRISTVCPGVVRDAAEIVETLLR